LAREKISLKKKIKICNQFIFNFFLVVFVSMDSISNYNYKTLYYEHWYKQSKMEFTNLLKKNDALKSFLLFAAQKQRYRSGGTGRRWHIINRINGFIYF
jgi:hypothetical protein